MEFNLEEIIKEFFSRQEWDQLPTYTKYQHKNVYKIHLDLNKAGFDIVPDYVEDYCRKNGREVPKSLLDIRSVENLKEASELKNDVTNREDEVPTIKKHGGKPTGTPKSRKKRKNKENENPDTLSALTNQRPKRTRKVINYREDDIPNDAYIYCDDCEEEFIDMCPYHGPLNYIPDNPHPKGDPDRALKTIPDEYLAVKTSTIAGLGVYAITDIPKGTQFGPYEGHHKKSTKLNTGYCWLLRNPMNGISIDALDTKDSNWMRYVNCSRHIMEQNLIPFQYRGGLYYRTFRDIPKGEELLVYYGDDFAKELGIDVKNYRNPLKKNLPSKKFWCTKCHLVFKTPVGLEDHQTRCDLPREPIIVQNSKVYPCSKCYLGFADREYLEKHEEKYCRNRFPPIVKTAGDVEDLNNNGRAIEDSHRNTPENLFMTKKKRSNNEGDDANKKHKCNKCPYKSKYSGDLKRHSETVHEKLKRWKCEICGKNFWQKSHLGRHIKEVHEKIKEFKCKQCNFECGQSGILNRHMRCKHTLEKAYKCSYCDYKTANSSNLKQHINRVHLGLKPFLCNECKRSFSQNYSLQDHIRRKHTFEKPFTCLHCDYKTAGSSELKVHIDSVHLKLKPFKCAHCSRCFTRKGSLQRHIRTRHANEGHM